MTRYFAYGSNLWNEQMRQRCPQSRRIGRAMLCDHRWIITTRGYASVVPSPGDVVEGVVFELTESDELAMDRFEGVSSGFYQKQILPVKLGDDWTEAMVYIDPVTEEGEPKEEYVRRINAGLVDAGLSADYVARQVRRFIRE